MLNLINNLEAKNLELKGIKQRLEHYKEYILKERGENYPSEDAVNYIDGFLDLIDELNA